MGRMCLAVPAKVKQIKKDRAIVDFGGVQREVSIGIITGIQINDYVLVHAGFAIGKVKKKQAEDTLKILEEMKNIR